jgi:oxysterol-binding protein-related protein 9/10/11
MHGVQAEGYTAQEITLSKTGSVYIKQIGHAIVSIPNFDEKHLVTLPSVLVKGILTGSPYPELNGKAYITSNSGYTSEIDFSGKTFGFGKKNIVNATLYTSGNPKDVLYEVSGQWNAQLIFTDKRTGEEVEALDTNSLSPLDIQVADISEQDPWESRRAWEHVITAVKNGNMQAISDEKSKIENAQRRIRSEREKKGESWEPIFFTKSERDPEFEELANRVEEVFGYDRTGGVWRFDFEKSNRIQKPFHGANTPLG